MNRLTMTAALALVLVVPSLFVCCDADQSAKRRTSRIPEVRMAAEEGHAVAQAKLGSMYYKGEGVPKDHREAAKWFRKAAEQGNAGAQAFLGGKYADGEGVLQDFVKAHAWMNLAAAQGDKEAAQDRDRLAARMTPEQMAEAQDLAAELYKRIESSKSE